jgi:hypothetical protein
MMRIAHLVTIHADAGRAAAVLIMASVAAMMKEKRIVWWVSPPDEQGDIKVMGRVPQDLPELSLPDLLEVYSLQPSEIPPLED